MPEKSYQEVWNKCLSIIRDNVPAQNLKTRFKPIQAVKLESKILTVQVPSQFFYEWLEHNYITLIKFSQNSKKSYLNATKLNNYTK